MFRGKKSKFVRVGLIVGLAFGLVFFGWLILVPRHALSNPTRYYYGTPGCIAEARIPYRLLWPLKVASMDQKLKVLVLEQGQWIEKPLVLSSEWRDEDGFTLRMKVPTNHWKIDYRVAVKHSVLLFGRQIKLFTVKNVWTSAELSPRADLERKIPDLKARGPAVP